MALVLESVWEQFLRIAKEEVGSSTVETWFKAVSFYEWDALKKTAYLLAPNIFVKEWITHNYMQLFVTHFSRLLCSTDIVIVIYAHTDEKKESIKTSIIALNQQKSGVKEKERFKPAHIVSPKDQKKIEQQRSTGLNESYQFDNFIVGPSNEFACAAAHAIIENPGSLYNPFFIYGKSGLGKTHVLHAVGNALIKKGKTVLYQTSDRFVSEFIDAIRLNHMHKFQKKYQQIDVLLVDDIQFMADKEQTQEAFFHLFNTLYDAHKQIVFTSDSYPQAIEGIAERLKSRLSGGLVADIKEPHLEMKIAIIKKKVEIHNTIIPDDVMQFIATNAGESIRELHGLITRLLALSSLTNVPISLDLARQICLKNEIAPANKINADILTIIKLVAKYYASSYEELRSKGRGKNIVRARHVAMFLVKQLTKKSLRDIALFFDAKSHASVKHAISCIEEDLEKDMALCSQIRDLETNIARKIKNQCSI